MSPAPHVRQVGPVAGTPQYGTAELDRLGLKSNDWGIGMELEFGLFAKDAKAAGAKNRELYIRHEAHGDGVIWNEEDQTATWTIDVEEYFLLAAKETGAERWITSYDKHNNWYRKSSGGNFTWDARSDWCGMSLHVSGTITVGRLYDKQGKRAGGRFYIDSATASGARHPVGVPESDIDSVAEADGPKEGSWTFVPDMAFEAAEYHYWVERDDCRREGRGPKDGPTTPSCKDDVLDRRRIGRTTVARGGAWYPRSK